MGSAVDRRRDLLGSRQRDRHRSRTPDVADLRQPLTHRAADPPAQDRPPPFTDAAFAARAHHRNVELLNEAGTDIAIACNMQIFETNLRGDTLWAARCSFAMRREGRTAPRLQEGGARQQQQAALHDLVSRLTLLARPASSRRPGVHAPPRAPPGGCQTRR